MCFKKFFANQRKHPTIFFGSKMAKIFDAENEKHNDFVISELDLKPTDRVLEIGFGSGWSIQKISKIVTDGYVAGIDHSRAMVKKATKLNKQAIRDEKVELQCGNADLLPYPSGSFDKIFAVYVMYFWDDPAKVLREIIRVLKSGGLFVVYLSTKETLSKCKFAKNFHSYAEQELFTLFSGAGFKNIDIKKITLNGVDEAFCVKVIKV